MGFNFSLFTGYVKRIVRGGAIGSVFTGGGFERAALYLGITVVYSKAALYAGNISVIEIQRSAADEAVSPVLLAGGVHSLIAGGGFKGTAIYRDDTIAVDGSTAPEIAVIYGGGAAGTVIEGSTIGIDMTLICAVLNSKGAVVVDCTKSSIH